MSGINKVILVGHLGKDPELRSLNGDVPVASFPLATSEMIGRVENKKEQTEWHTIVLWRGLAENAAKSLKKDDLIYLEGQVRTRSFTDKTGTKKYATEIVAEHFKLLSTKANKS